MVSSCCHRSLRSLSLSMGSFSRHPGNLISMGSCPTHLFDPTTARRHEAYGGD